MIAEPRKGGTEPGLSAGFPFDFWLFLAVDGEKGVKIKILWCPFVRFRTVIYLTALLTKWLFDHLIFSFVGTSFEE